MRKTLPYLVILTLVISVLACSFTPSLSGSNPTQTPLATLAKLPAESENLTNNLVSPENIASLAEKDQLLTTLYETVSPGVVAIMVLSETGGGLGSGFVFDKQGHIVTNYHVVEGATELEVDLPSGSKYRGEIIATDLDSDLAVIQINAPEDQLFPLSLGDSDLIKVGQSVIAIGNPFGLTGTMTVGIVSAKGRTMESFRESESGGYFTAGDLIQTDAAINPGNSGGPLLNLLGEVVGLNRAIQTETTNPNGEPVNSGVGFAISANIIKRVVPVLIAQGAYDYPYIGITSQSELTLIEQEALGLPTSVGAYISSVSPNSPADKAGLRGGNKTTSILGLYAGGDLITSVDGRPVQVFGDLLSYLMTNKSPGDTINLTILRDGNEKEVSVTLGKRP